MIKEATDHIESVQSLLRRKASRIGKIEAEHGPGSERAREARREYYNLIEAVATELDELADLAHELKREYDL